MKYAKVTQIIGFLVNNANFILIHSCTKHFWVENFYYFNYLATLMTAYGTYQFLT